MNESMKNDLQAFPEVLATAKAYADEFLAGLEARPVIADAANLELHGGLPERGSGAKAAIEHFREHYDALLSASAGPRYLGFVTGGSTPAALAGDWLASAFDQNAQLNNDTIAPYLEEQALTWLGELLGFSHEHTGICVTGATMANFTGLAIARQWLGEQQGVDIARAGLNALPPVRVLSGAAHSSIGKALAMLGIGADAIEAIPRLPGREAVDVNALAKRLGELQEQPVIVVANAGIVNTGDFDDLEAIAELKREHAFWLHADGAFGAFAGASERFRHLTAGIEKADSVTVDGHKWMNVPYDGAYLFTRHLDSQLQVFRNTSPYLPSPVRDAKNVLHLGPENSRRWRALPLWFALQAYGRDGVREMVERSCDMAAKLAAGIEALQDYVLLAPVRLNIACFTFADAATPERIKALQQYLASENAAYMSPTVHDGKPALRAAFCNWRTETRHVEKMLAALREFVD